jgi:general nucleoside transport system ATP-binding protein
VAERLVSLAFSRHSWIRQKAARAHASQVMAAFDVRGGGLQTQARSLSGGNMQKLILGRALLPVQDDARTVPCLIIAHQPTWGLDIGAVAYVQAQLIAARDAGAAVLVISDDLDEVLTLGDRIAVMHGGHLTDARPAEDWTREAIGLAMAGLESGVVHAVTSVGAKFPDGPPLGKLAPSGGSAVREATSVGATS